MWMLRGKHEQVDVKLWLLFGRDSNSDLVGIEKNLLIINIDAVITKYIYAFQAVVVAQTDTDLQ